MSLKEAFDSLPARRSGSSCYTCRAIRDMGADDAATLQGLMAGDVSSSMISEACKRAGFVRVSEGSIKRHRKGGCLGLS